MLTKREREACAWTWATTLRRRISSKRRRAALALVSLVVLLALIVVSRINGIPVGTAMCAVKEWREAGAWYGQSRDETNKHSLAGARPLPPGLPRCDRGVDDPVKIRVLDWTYTDAEGPGLRFMYASATSVPALGVPPSCASSCEVLRAFTEADIDDADLVVLAVTDHGRAWGPVWCERAFAAPFQRHVDDPSAPNRKQLWGMFSVEHAGQFPMLYDKRVQAAIDMTISYHSASDVRVSWMCPEDGGKGFPSYFGRPTPPTFARPFLLAAVASRCRNDWMAYVNELEGMLPPARFARFGFCWGENSRFVPAVGNMYESKIHALSKAKFVLVFENTKSITDYVTEKLSHALLAGAVPVVWGAPNVREFLPSNDSAIVVSGTELERSPQALASLLLRLDKDDDALARFHAWRSRPRSDLSPGFQWMLSHCVTRVGGCDACAWVREQRRHRRSCSS